MRIWTALCGFAVLATLAACGGSGSSSDSTPAASIPSSPSGGGTAKGIDPPSSVSIVSPTN